VSLQNARRFTAEYLLEGQEVLYYLSALAIVSRIVPSRL
jgi:hypothetical protein